MDDMDDAWRLYQGELRLGGDVCHYLNFCAVEQRHLLHDFEESDGAGPVAVGNSPPPQAWPLQRSSQGVEVAYVRALRKSTRRCTYVPIEAPPDPASIRRRFDSHTDIPTALI
jgi:hypothetical protein